MDYTRLGRLANWFTVGLVIGGFLVWGMTPAHAGWYQSIVKGIQTAINLQSHATDATFQAIANNPQDERKPDETTDCHHADDLQLLRVGVLHHSYIRSGRQDCNLHDLLHRE